MKIQWSDNAKASYYQIGDFLLDNWGSKIFERYASKVDVILKNIEHHPYLYPIVEEMDIHKALIHPNASLIYRVLEKEILIIAVIDNRSDPTKWEELLS